MRSALTVGSAAFALMLGASSAGAEAPSLTRTAIVPIVVARHAVPVAAKAWPRVIVVARINIGGGRGHAYGRLDERGWRARGYRPVTVYVVDGRYYDRWDDRYRGHNVRQIVVYERGGRYYRDWDDDRYDNRYDNRRDRYDDRRDRYDDRRDRYDDRRDRNDDRRDRYDDRSDRGRYGH
jgi:hypothetical protein